MRHDDSYLLDMLLAEHLSTGYGRGRLSAGRSRPSP